MFPRPSQIGRWPRYVAAGIAVCTLIGLSWLGVMNTGHLNGGKSKIIEKSRVTIELDLLAPLDRNTTRQDEFWLVAHVERAVEEVERMWGPFEKKPRAVVIDVLPSGAKEGYHAPSRVLYFGREWTYEMIAGEFARARLDERYGLAKCPPIVVEGLAAYVGGEGRGSYLPRLHDLFRSKRVGTLREVGRALESWDDTDSGTRENVRSDCLVIVYSLLHVRGLSIDELISVDPKTIPEPADCLPMVLSVHAAISRAQRVECRVEILRRMFEREELPEWNEPFPINGTEADIAEFFERSEVREILINTQIHDEVRKRDTRYHEIAIVLPKLRTPQQLRKRFAEDHCNGICLQAGFDVLSRTPGDALDALKKRGAGVKALTRAELADGAASKELWRRIEDTGVALVCAELGRGATVSRLESEARQRIAYDDWNIQPQIEEKREPSDLIMRGIDLPTPKK